MENEKNNEVQTDATTELKAKTKSSKKFKWFYLIIPVFIIVGVISFVYFSKPEPKETYTNSIGMKMIWVPSGEFMMGSGLSASQVVSKYGGNSNWFKDEHPQHKVTITEGFWIGQFEVTQAQYKDIMGKNPSRFKGDNNPVEQVSWHDAMDFCNKLSRKESQKYSLPTEAQWEYACRAGNTTAYSLGDSSNLLVDYAWYKDNSGDKTYPVGKKKPNPFGLYDMHGNVWEWCNDWYGQDYYSSSPLVDPLGPQSGSSRILRGGSQNSSFFHCRSAHRNQRGPDFKGSIFGFRVVLSKK